MSKRAPHRFEETTEATAENRDSRGRPLPKLPPADYLSKSSPRLAWERMLAHGRRRASSVSISSLLRFRRLSLPTPVMTAMREPVKQFVGLGFTIQLAGLLGWFGLWWKYEISGAVVGAIVALTCYVIGRAKSKPWRCGNCKTPLATAKVRVCPGCCARLVDLDAVKVMPRAL